MNWVSTAFMGIIIGYAAFGLAWVILSNWFGKTEVEKAVPERPTMWAMAFAFAIIALSWSGFFRDIVPPGYLSDPYVQGR